MKLNIKSLGLAFGLTFAGFYLACVVFMIVASKEIVILFFNSLMHGIDVTSVLKMNVPLGETILGFVSTFILGWIMGAIIGWTYNSTLKK